MHLTSHTYLRRRIMAGKRRLVVRDEATRHYSDDGRYYESCTSNVNLHKDPEMPKPISHHTALLKRPNLGRLQSRHVNVSCP